MKIDKARKLFIVFVSLSGAYSVLFGAWLSHQGDLLPTLKIAHFYQFLHTIALLAVCFFWQSTQPKAAFLTATLLSLGMLLFSGSLYVKVLFACELIGKLTPFGGILLSLAWLSVLIHLNIRKH
ncbi:DUF423 domain-containing protein [Thalassotalea sp. 1_MG-2023]|uniref:DUF423 domain-containing protein n=1 Tax=Thalassotalea sp. 1_MG-2023 TaxID=3062680 RepID=UPI0026E4497D|nr:DUF423 domain-containing protein [Thalassotalea sp. 1_MG-2023]MDO6426813.1 DUF423 domain-containing protein [Thalassotalea sp. 1_MG-2023]